MPLEAANFFIAGISFIVAVNAGHFKSNSIFRSSSRSIARITRSYDFGVPVTRSYDSGDMPYRLIDSAFGGQSARKSAQRSPIIYPFVLMYTLKPRRFAAR